MTTQEQHEQYLLNKRIEKNLKDYHTDVINIYSGQVVATCAHWDYILEIYSDKSAAIYYKAKPGTGYASGQYCGTDILKSHLTHLKRYEKEARPGLIPLDWEVINPAFFKALNIE